MRIKKFLKIDNYITFTKKILRKIKLIKLGYVRFQPSKLHLIWHPNLPIDYQFNICKDFNYYIFGKEILLDRIEWQKDYHSGHVYPLLKIDKLHIENWFNKGIDVKFPWELSRFYFAVNLAQKYLITQDQAYYKYFRALVINWKSQNPFLKGVNWLSTMEVAVRSINLITACNFFYEPIENDAEFNKEISSSFSQHAEFISSFIEVYEHGFTTNHTTACYAGLLFLALTLKDNTKSQKWIDQAMNGLERCIDEQVYEDGADFEGSLPYHRLVLEMFAYSALVIASSNHKFSDFFYKKLFRMFEFTAAYVDASGSAPQFGDNDSGRILIFNSMSNNNPYKKEFDHSYLIDIGEKIFDYKFATDCKTRNNETAAFLPNVKRIDIKRLNIIPRKSEALHYFPAAGIVLLKNNFISLHLSCIPLGQKGNGGHNHLDCGSFTLSLGGNQAVVDPGTLVYSANKKVRDEFRSYTYHNNIYSEKDEGINWSENDFWELKNYYNCTLEKVSNTQAVINIKFIGDSSIRKRKFSLGEKYLMIEDSIDGHFYSRLNLHPDVAVINQSEDKISFSIGELVFEPKCSYRILNYDYSPHYGKKINSKCVIFHANNFLKLTFQV